MIEVLKSGLWDTIQDLGRFGVQDLGIPYSGAMDVYASKLANAILGNAIHAAVLEITLTGPTLQFRCATSICITGADFSAKLNNNPIRTNILYNINKDDVLTFGRRQYGCRGYIAVKYGFQTEVVMKSRSMYQHITAKVRLKKGDMLPIKEKHNNEQQSNASVLTEKLHFVSPRIDVYKGPEFEALDKVEQQLLLSSEFSISKDSNRMAYQLNEKVDHNLETFITSVVLPGTVQLTPSGQLIILMRDCQVTGGYPRILQVSEQSICRLAQKISMEKIRFKCIN